MGTKKIPVVYYPNGIRTVVGEAFVEIDGGGAYLFIDGKVTDEQIKRALTNEDIKQFSIGPFVAQTIKE